MPFIKRFNHYMAYVVSTRFSNDTLHWNIFDCVLFNRACVLAFFYTESFMIFSGYGKGHDHEEGWWKKDGKKGHKDFDEWKGWKGKKHGDHGDKHSSGYHGKHGKKFGGHDDSHKYYGDKHEGWKGKKGHKHGSKGHHDKGHKKKVSSKNGIPIIL